MNKKIQYDNANVWLAAQQRFIFKKEAKLQNQSMQTNYFENKTINVPVYEEVVEKEIAGIRQSISRWVPAV